MAEGSGGGEESGMQDGNGSPLCINMSSCRYEAVRTCSTGMGWAVVGGLGQQQQQQQQQQVVQQKKRRGNRSAAEPNSSKSSPGAEAGGSGVGGALRAGGGGYDLYWSDKSLTRTRFTRLLDHQMVNHFPEMHELCCKSFLSSNLDSMKQKHPASYDFYPDTWVIPVQHREFERECRRRKATKKDEPLFIVKPERGSQGRGIFLTRTGEEDEIKQSLWNLGHLLVAQRYIARPLLIDGYKFDLRIYVLVTSCDPLRIYIYRDGLARFCTEKYCNGFPWAREEEEKEKDKVEKTADEGGQKSKWVYSHLTNTSLNKANKERFKHSADDEDASVGNKRKVSSVFELLKSEGRDVDKLWQEIEDVVVKTFVSAQPLLAHHHRLDRPQDKFGDRCFEILGVDILVDSNMKPWLLELNHSPSFHCEGLVDDKIKRPMIAESLRIIEPTLKRRAALRPPRDAQGGGEGEGGEGGGIPSVLLEEMRRSVAAGRGVGEADPEASSMELSEFEKDRPRYHPPGEEREEWVGRSDSEEEAWEREVEKVEERVLDGFKRCYPPEKGSEREEMYASLLESARIVHAKRTKLPKKPSKEDDDTGDDEVLSLSSSGSSFGKKSDLDDDDDDDDDHDGDGSLKVGADDVAPGRAGGGDGARKRQGGKSGGVKGKGKGKGTRVADDDDDDDDDDGAGGSGKKGMVYRVQKMMLRWSATLFSVAMVFPPLMIILYVVFRRMRMKDYEAKVWCNVCFYTLFLQIPIATCLVLMQMRVNELMADIKSGKNSIPMDQFLKEEYGGGGGGGGGGGDRKSKILKSIH